MVFAVSMLQHALLWPVVVIHTHARAIQPHHLVRQRVHREPVPRQRRIHRRLVHRPTHHRQHIGQAIITQIGLPQRLSDQVLQRPQAVGRPLPHTDHPMVPLHQQVTQPHADRGPHTDPLPVPVRPDLGINHAPHPQLLNDPQQQGQVVDLLARDGIVLAHPSTLPYPLPSELGFELRE